MPRTARADRGCLLVGNGYTGARLLAALPAGDAAAVSRSHAAPINGNPVHVVDLDAPRTPDLPGCGASVVYTVPPARTDGPDPRLSRLLDALTDAPRRFVYFSTSGVYGDRDGATVDETSPPRPATRRAHRRVDAERRLTEWCTLAGTALIVLRVPGIYGPGRLGLERLRDGGPYVREADAGPGNRIHVDDLVRVARAAALDPVPAGTYNVGDGDHRSSTWFARTVAELAGLPPPREISREQAEREFSARRLSFLRESRRLDTTRMRDVLQVTPRYADAADGIRASLATG